MVFLADLFFSPGAICSLQPQILEGHVPLFFLSFLLNFALHPNASVGLKK